LKCARHRAHRRSASTGVLDYFTINNQME